MAKPASQAVIEYALWMRNSGYEVTRVETNMEGHPFTRQCDFLGILIDYFGSTALPVERAVQRTLIEALSPSSLGPSEPADALIDLMEHGPF